METRKPYPTDVSDEEWAFVAPYLTLMRADAPQREHKLREVFNALRWLVRAGAPWRLLPHEFPPWAAVYQQTQRWLAAGSFEAIVHDLRALLRLAEGREAQPSAVIFDARTLQSTPESGGRAGYDGHKRKKGSKTHAAVDTLGHLLALMVTPANEQDRAQVARLAVAVQEATGEHVEVAVEAQNVAQQLRPKAVHHRHDDDQRGDPQHDAEEREAGNDGDEAFPAPRPQVTPGKQPFKRRERQGARDILHGATLARFRHDSSARFDEQFFIHRHIPATSDRTPRTRGRGM